jgi:hypothetical protein
MLRCMSSAHLSRAAGRHAEAQAAVEQALSMLVQAAAEVAADQGALKATPAKEGSKSGKDVPTGSKHRSRPQPPGVQPVMLLKLAREAAAVRSSSSSSTRQALQALCTMLQQCVGQGRLLPHAAREARTLIVKLSKQ